MNSKYRYVAVAGPTASGKSGLALKLAEDLQGEIVNCDSIQVYRGFNIGSAKPGPQELDQVPHHLFDIVEADEPFDAVQYAKKARATIDEIISRNRTPIVVGGTGLYLRSLWGQNFHSLPKDEQIRTQLDKLSNQDLVEELQQVDPKRASEVHPNDRFRLVRAVELSRLLGKPVSSLEISSDSSFEAFKIKMKVERKILHERIEKRSSDMLRSGLVEEVKDLIGSGVSLDSKPMQSIGYKQVVDFFQGNLTQEELAPAIIIATRQYAKRQETWFRKVSFDLTYHDGDYQNVLKKVKEALGNF